METRKATAIPTAKTKPSTSSRVRKREQSSPSGELIYIHIGKCGGTSLWDAIQRSAPVAKRYPSIRKVHVATPPISHDADYLIVVRNPIDRVVSAFNWRLKLVVTDGEQKDRFPGEFSVLTKYRSLNALAEALYKNGVLVPSVAEDFLKIHHLRESISFYLSDLLTVIRRKQVFAVMATEHLDADVERVLGVKQVKRIHDNRAGSNAEKSALSGTARRNLRHFLAPDYDALNRLTRLFPVAPETQKLLMQ